MSAIQQEFLFQETFQYLSSKIGMPSDQIRLGITLMTTVPIGLIFTKVDGYIIRLTIGSLLGILFEFVVFGNAFKYHLIQSFIVYALVKLFPRRCGPIVLIFSLIYLSYFHLYRQFTDYGGWQMDITTTLMMSICKYTAFAWSVHDGSQKPEQLSPQQEAQKLTQCPTFLEFFSYIHFFAGCIMGPFIDFNDFSAFNKKEGIYQQIPSPLSELFRLTIRFIVFMSVTIIIFPQFPYSKFYDDDWGRESWFYKFFYYNFSVILFRVRYYGGWTMAQIASVATGLTYGGYDEQNKVHKWDKVLTVLPEMEFSHDIQWKVEQWNASVQIWLQRYIYNRVYTPQEIAKNPGKANIAQYVTLFVSSFWHGFYPGYYIAFFLWSFMLDVCQCTYKASVNMPELFSQIKKTTGPLYYIVRWVLPNLMLNCFGAGFMLLSAEANYQFFKNINFDVIIIAVSISLFYKVTGFGQRKPKDKANSQKKDVKQDN